MERRARVEDLGRAIDRVSLNQSIEIARALHGRQNLLYINQLPQ